MNLSENIRNKIADQTLRIIAPAIIMSMIFAGLAMYFTGDRHYHRLIAGLIAVIAVMPALMLARKGRPRAGITIILLAICLAIFYGMIFSGGVRAPAYIAVVAGITLFTLLYGARGAILFGGLMVGAGALFIWLDRMGYLREAAPPSDLFYLMFIATYLILQSCFVFILVRLMNRALLESQSQQKDLRQTVHKWQQSKRELESILNRTPDIIYRLDPEGRFTFISDAVRKYGQSPDAFRGKPISAFVHPADKASSRRGLHERRSGERGVKDLEVRLGMGGLAEDRSQSPEEDFRNFLISSEGLYSGSAETGLVFEGTQGIARDVSITRQYQSRIVTLAAVVEQAAEDVVITDPDGVIRYVNPSFERLTGYARKEVEGKKTGIFKSGKQDRAFYSDLWRTVKQGRTWNGRIWNRIKDGSLIFQDVTITPIMDAWGDITGYASIRRDITAQEKLEARLKQSRKMEAMGTLAGGIAHDFNNILGAILGYSELALADLPADDPVRLYVDQILKAGDRAKDLVRQILLFSRQAKQENQPVQVITLAKEVIKLLKATLEADIEIKTEFMAKTGLVLSDPARIHQIFMNLCTNAAHAMKEGGGTLTIAVEEGQLERLASGTVSGLSPKRYLKISVSDTGCGIPAQIREKIFDPFFTTKSREEGTGMGLSVVYGIVEDHGGAVHVASEAGQGTTFSVFLPAVSSQERSASETKPVIPGGNEHILFVDDEPDLVGLGKTLLERLGYETTAFSDSLKAWQAFKDDPDRFDLVVTDKRMAGMSGMELAGKILALRPQMPVIMCTGFSETLTSRQAETLGIRKLLNKPVTTRDIGEAVRSVLDG